MRITAGEAQGATTTTDNGGRILVTAGGAAAGHGGDIELVSGSSNATSSGSIELKTPGAGTIGVSGMIDLTTGQTTAGSSGAFEVTTGDALQGAGGDIVLKVGAAEQKSDTSCYCHDNGADYRGTVNTDTSSATCDTWSASMIASYPDAGLGSERLADGSGEEGFGRGTRGHPHNYCRNPTGHTGGPWCYVGGTQSFCSVSRCAEGHDGTRCASSAGSSSLTRLAFKVWACALPSATRASSSRSPPTPPPQPSTRARSLPVPSGKTASGGFTNAPSRAAELRSQLLERLFASLLVSPSKLSARLSTLWESLQAEAVCLLIAGMPAFFPDGKFKTNFLCNIGYGDHSKVFARSPRFAFDEVCKIV